MELTSGYRALPESVAPADSGLFVSAVNHSDDVKMLFRRRVEGLQPNTPYRLRFTVRFATNVPSGCVGIGGAPGESVKVLADASPVRPEPVVQGPSDDYYVLNVQHHEDPGEWYENAIIGDISNSQECEEDPEYEIKQLTSDEVHDTVITNENGEAWLLFGTRSGFEGESHLYVTYFRAELQH